MLKIKTRTNELYWILPEYFAKIQHASKHEFNYS